MRLLLLLQAALCVSAALVAAAPIGRIDELMRRIELTDITTGPQVGKDPNKIAAAKQCVKDYCDTHVPGAVSAEVTMGPHPSPSDPTKHITTNLKDKNGEFINGFMPGTTTQAQADADGVKKEAQKQAKNPNRAPNPNPPANPPDHHVDPTTNGPTPQMQKVMGKNGGKFPIPAPP
ncbi:hypothetical protein IE81DRAFT_343555 [Ceraceosorus guamensis]|uniref:Uncharacterized protein n=1 Tax=Ceraceosorus guamensis TaxID=1522189 RepID=A0A316VNH1_9BASI|nr:hypothetical protein IE81DRAFT_343555 [Ceraceosorus guamensis]PWN39117.1 hypothetical protein IE81DRAFT_343555 [Ceraceosorus guamensis]